MGTTLFLAGVKNESIEMDERATSVPAITVTTRLGTICLEDDPCESEKFLALI
jgi:hypothetical protein